MVDKKTSQEVLSGAIVDGDYVRGVQGGGNVRILYSAVKTWIKSWITKADVGLGNVDNTSDINKPISTATQTALNLKVDTSMMPTPFAVGDVLYASAAAVLSKIAAVTAGQPFISDGTVTAPKWAGSWAKFDVANKRLVLNKNTVLVTPGNSNTILQLIGLDTGTEHSLEFNHFNTDGVVNCQRANGTSAATTPLALDDYVATFVAGGIDTNGGSYKQGNAFTHRASENWTNTKNGMYSAIFGTTTATLTFGEWVRWKDGKYGIGDTNPQYKLTVNQNATSGIADPFGNAGVGIIGADAASVNLALRAFGAAANPNITMFKAGGTNAAPTAAVLDTVIAQFQAFPYAGSTSLYVGGGGFSVKANENTGTGAAGCRLELTATANGTTTQVVVATLYGSRGIFVGASPADPGAGIIQTTGGFVSPSFTVASLPAGVAGKQVYCSNARVVNTTTGAQEGAGVGTGSLVNYNTSFKLPGTNLVALA